MGCRRSAAGVLVFVVLLTLAVTAPDAQERVRIDGQVQWVAATRMQVMTGGGSVAVDLRQAARADDAPPPPLAPVVDRLFPEFKKKAADLPPFLRDADVILHLRTFYFNRHKPDDTDNEALATGGWLSYRSGWLFDTFSMGATFYGSAPLYAPDDRDGTLLLQPDQKGYYVPGEAWGALRYKEYARFTGYRQKIDVGYVNSHDNRMTPNTFEAVTLGGKVGILEYFTGYLWNMKTRNSDD